MISRPLLLGLLATAALGFSACADDLQPVSSKLITDVPPPKDAGADDATGVPAMDAGSDGYASSDAHILVCSGCVCPAETAFCFAGATVLAPVDGGTPTCSVAAGATPQVGCNALPAACAAAPTCACIIDTLQPLYRCYLNCMSSADGFLVYCPNP